MSGLQAFRHFDQRICSVLRYNHLGDMSEHKGLPRLVPHLLTSLSRLTSSTLRSGQTLFWRRKIK